MDAQVYQTPVGTSVRSENRPADEGKPVKIAPCVQKKSYINELDDETGCNQANSMVRLAYICMPLVIPHGTETHEFNNRSRLRVKLHLPESHTSGHLKRAFPRLSCYLSLNKYVKMLCNAVKNCMVLLLHTKHI